MKLNITINYFLLILTLFLASCDGSKPVARGGLDASSNDDIFNILDEKKLCPVSKYKTQSLPTKHLKTFFTAKFEDSKSFNDFEIVTQDNETYYLIASGKRERRATKFAIELEVQGSDLYLQDLNKLYYTCIGHYCDDCNFKYSSKGTIGGCDCGHLTEEPPKGFSPCEHTIAIKTKEKE